MLKTAVVLVVEPQVLAMESPVMVCLSVVVESPVTIRQ